MNAFFGGEGGGGAGRSWKEALNVGWGSSAGGSSEVPGAPCQPIAPEWVPRKGSWRSVSPAGARAWRLPPTHRARAVGVDAGTAAVRDDGGVDGKDVRSSQELHGGARWWRGRSAQL